MLNLSTTIKIAYRQAGEIIALRISGRRFASIVHTMTERVPEVRWDVNLVREIYQEANEATANDEYREFAMKWYVPFGGFAVIH